LVLLVAQQLNPRDYAILTEGKATNAMIAGRAQWSSALTALNDGRISDVKCAVHY